MSTNIEQNIPERWKIQAALKVIAKHSPLWNNVITMGCRVCYYYSRETIESHVAELKNLILIKGLYEDVEATMISPSSSVDEMWHQLILFTREYAALCEDLLTAVKSPSTVRLLHHNPMGSLDEDAANQRARYNNTRRVYEVIVGQKIPKDIWPDSEGLPPNESRLPASSSAGKKIDVVELSDSDVSDTVQLRIKLGQFADKVAVCDVPRSVSMKKVMDEFMQSQGKETLHFGYKWARLTGNETPASLGWREGDTIYATEEEGAYV